MFSRFKKLKQENTQLKANQSTLIARSKILSQITKSHNEKRDLYKIFGYQSEPDIDSYIGRFLRQDIAKRVVETYPKTCWADIPHVTDDNDTEDETEFEKAVTDLMGNTKLKLASYIRRLDILTGLGSYGVLFIGVRDGKDPKEPLEVSLTEDDILFLSPYSEKNAAIAAYDEDPQSPRYGLPVMYTLSSGGYGNAHSANPSAIAKNKTVQVHHTRVIHVAEGTLENDVYGTPRLQPVLNRLVDLEKVVGGSAESFFLNARGGIHMDQKPDTQLVNSDKLEERMEEFAHNYTTYLRTKGIDVKTLNFEVADPKNHFDVILSLVAATTGIPTRILLGSERGELASSQDEKNWLNKVRERQTDFCEMQILRPLIDWFMLNGIIPEPKDGRYDVDWKDLVAVSELEQAEIAVKVTTAMATYLNANGSDMIMPPEQFFSEVLKREYREDDLPDLDIEPDAQEDEES